MRTILDCVYEGLRVENKRVRIGFDQREETSSGLISMGEDEYDIVGADTAILVLP